MSTSPASTRAPHSRLQAVTNGNGYDYLLALPEGFRAGAAKRWPLVLFLHGTGERGSDVWAVTRQGIPHLLAHPEALNAAEQEAARKLASCIVLAPQCPQLETWEDARLLALLDEAAKTFPVDPARIYLTGLSMGGFGAWSLAMRHPQRFAALVAVCGGGRLADVASARGKRKLALQQLPVWAFHGAQDGMVPAFESERMVAGLKKIGAKDIRLTMYPNTGHDAWTPAFATAPLYRWMLKQRR